MSYQRPFHVFVNHAEPLVAQGLAAVLAGHADLKVHLDPPPADVQIDVLVTDLRQGVAQATQRTSAMGPLRQARVLVLGMSCREHELRRAMEVGIQGFLVLGCALEEIATAVRALGMGTRYYDMSLLGRVAESMTREALTGRESEVLARLVQGKCNKSIARDMSIALGTVKSHVKAILEKLDASSRTHAASIAMQRGLIAGEPADLVVSDLPLAPVMPAQRSYAMAA